MTRAQYNHELRKAILGDNLANHMAYIFAIALYDKFDLSFKQVTNYYERVSNLRKQWQDDDNEEITSDWLLDYARKKHIDVVGYVNSIPSRQKLMLADVGTRNHAEVGMMQNVNSAFVGCICLSLPTLKETYRFSNDKIREFLDQVKYYIDLYTTKIPGGNKFYFDDEYVRQIFIDDEHWDIKEGRKVEVES